MVTPEQPVPAGEPSRGGVRNTRVSVAATLDDDLMRALYDEHAGPLFGYVVRLTGGDRQQAEDVVQETMLRAWRNPRAMDGSAGSIRPWLLTVARNLVIDRVRARRSRPQEVREPATALAVDDGIDQMLLAQTMSEVLAQLSPAHRDVLLATYYRGRTVAEAAAELGVPPGTVKSRTYYALRALRLALEERGVEL